MTCEPCISLPEREEDSLLISSSDTPQLSLWSGTPTAAKSCGNEPKKDGSPACWCGRETFGCSIHPNTRDEWIASMRASLVRTLATPEIAQALERTRAAASTAKSSASLAWFDRDSCSWKTYQQSLVTDWEPYSETWPRAGMTAGGRAYPLPSLAPRINATDGGSLLATPTQTANQMAPSMQKWAGCALWQTLVADDAVNRTAGKVNSRGEPKLSAQVLWPTPHGFSKDGRSNGPSGNGLGRAVNQAMWPTPTSRDHKDGTAQSCANVPVNGLLGRAIFATTRTADSKGQGMSKARADKPDNLLAQLGGSLNPWWVEWLMGWPLGWTVSKHWATAKSLSKRRSRGKS